MNHPAGYVRGVAVMVAVAVLFSLTGLILRHVESADPWTVIVWRSVALCAAVVAFLIARHGAHAIARILAMGWPGAIAGLGLGLDNVFFLMAIPLTTIANVSFLLATAPFFTAVLGLLLLREPVPRRTWFGIAVAMVGAGVMVAEGITLGGWLGDLLALLATLGYAGYAVALRWGRQVDMWPSVLLGGLVALAISLVLSGDIAIGANDLALCVLQGAAVGALGNMLLTWCARHVPAAELTLLGLVESILAPLWVWLVLGETATAWALGGGALILGAVLASTLIARRAR
ncbi:MAG: DMT family transporter [Alphaproteobacteria bacterium]|nr:DMT family transporter [Alphaproteobacteria bacterium]